jgi:hypothetical protein
MNIPDRLLNKIIPGLKTIQTTLPLTGGANDMELVGVYEGRR